MPNHPVIPCSQRADWADTVEQYAEALKASAHAIGEHGLTQEAFEESGLFKSAIERIRGQQAATTNVKYAFIETVLLYLQQLSLIRAYSFVGNRERHDFEVTMLDGRLVCVEAKGCLDGNNTNIFVRPENADEFLIWSLCQNPGSDPRHNAWSGIHTRLGAELVANRQRIDGVVIWDMLCGTLARPCPKLEGAPERGTMLGGRQSPPPCIYLFPRTVPDPRNNPSPPVWRLDQVQFLGLLANTFRLRPEEVINVQIDARMQGVDIQRQTTFSNGGGVLHQSNWTTVRRAR